MTRLNVVLAAVFFLLCTGIFNTAYSNTNKPAQDVIEDATQVDEDDEYSHESVIAEDSESEYEDPKTDDVITSDTDEDVDGTANDTDEEMDDSHYVETMEEGEEI